MIFLLAMLLSTAPRVHAQLNLSRGSLRLKGPFSTTRDQNILVHAESGHRVDLSPFRDRARALCPHLLVAQHTILDQASAALPGLEDDLEPDPSTQAPRAYRAITLNVEREVLRVISDLFRPDELITVWPRPTSTVGRPEIVLARAISNLVELLAAFALNLDGVPATTVRELVVSGKFEDTGDFAADSFSIPLQRLYPTAHFLTLMRGEVLPLGDRLIMVTPNGRRLFLTAAPPIAGSSALSFAERFGDSLIKAETVLAGIEVNQELRVFTKF